MEAEAAYYIQHIVSMRGGDTPEAKHSGDGSISNVHLEAKKKKETLI